MFLKKKTDTRLQTIFYFGFYSLCLSIAKPLHHTNGKYYLGPNIQC